jgi:hypothetical protein
VIAVNLVVYTLVLRRRWTRGSRATLSP